MKLREFWKIVGVDLRPNPEEVLQACPGLQLHDQDGDEPRMAEVMVVRVTDGSAVARPVIAGGAVERRFLSRRDALALGRLLGDVVAVEVEVYGTDA